MFMVKVLSIVCAQLSIMMGVVVCVHISDEFKIYALEHTELWNGSIYGMFIFLFLTLALEKVHTLNFVCLLGFTLSTSYMIAVPCIYIPIQFILYAFVLAMTLFVSLSIFAYSNSHMKFSEFDGLLSICLWLLIVGTVLNGLFHIGGWLNVFILITGLCLFGAYVIYDMDHIMNTRSYDEYISASIHIYLDIVNIFVRIIECISMMCDSESEC